MSLHKMLRAAAGYQAPAPANTDPQFNYVSLLLHGDGTNGAQNNTFLDSSSNNFTITRNGNTTQGSLSPYGNLWSNFFDGTGDYLTVAAATALDITSGDFTIEAWVLPGTQTNSVDSVFGYGFWTTMLYRNGSTWTWEVGNGSSSNYFTLSATCTQNVWQHIALTRAGNTYTFWLNGVAASTTTNTNGPATASRTLAIGVNSTVSTTQSFTGYISNFRIVKGTAVYTSAFTSPTAPLTAVSGTSLLTCQSNRLIDNSANNFTITVAGDVRVTKEAPFLPTAAYSTSVIGGSGYFDGTGDYLTVANNSAFNLDTGDYTVDFWFNVDTVASVTYSILGPWSYPNGWLFQQVNNAINFYGNGGNISGFHTSGPILRANEWTHVAVTRSGTTSRMFVNGSLVSSTSVSIGASSNMLGVGINPQGLNEPFKGYLSNLRIVKGTAAYTAAFTPPTLPVTAISGTSLLLNFTNAGIFDNAAENVLETVGNAQISTSVKKYGTGSLAFDGTGDWLLVPDNTNLQLGSGSFTVEGWVNLALLGSARGLVSKGTSTTGWSLSVNSLNQVVFTDATTAITTTTALMANTWYHVAVVRSGTGTNQTVIYINGVSSATGTSASNFNQTSVMYVGADRTGGSALNGYIDDLRITKGYARYTSTFTPPTAAFPDQ